MRDAVLYHLRLQRPAAERDKKLAIGDRYGEVCPAVGYGRKLFDKAAFEGVNRDFLGVENPLAGKLLLKLFHIAVGVDGNTVGGPAAAMQAFGIGQADLDPGQQPPGGRAPRLPARPWRRRPV